MKTFVIYCTDKPGTEQKRLDARDAHFAHIEAVMSELFVAGPFKDAHGTTVGSLLIVKTESAQAARAWLEKDPYYAADIWADIAIHEFVAAAGKWIGGKIW